MQSHNIQSRVEGSKFPIPGDWEFPEGKFAVKHGIGRRVLVSLLPFGFGIETIYSFPCELHKVLCRLQEVGQLPGWPVGKL